MAAFPDFTQVPLQSGNLPPAGDGYAAWAKRFQSETGQSPEAFIWETPERLPVKPFYAASDLEGIDQIQPAQVMEAIGYRSLDRKLWAR